MNRHERRAARKRGDMIFIDYGSLQERDQNYGLPVECYACGKTHKASGIARIEDSQSFTFVPLCEPCLAADSRGNGVMRKFLNAPELSITEGGEATAEQITALNDKQNTTEH